MSFDEFAEDDIWDIEADIVADSEIESGLRLTNWEKVLLGVHPADVCSPCYDFQDVWDAEYHWPRDEVVFVAPYYEVNQYKTIHGGDVSRDCGLVLPEWELSLIDHCSEEAYLAMYREPSHMASDEYLAAEDIWLQQQKEIAYFDSFPPSKINSDHSDRQHER